MVYGNPKKTMLCGIFEKYYLRGKEKFLTGKTIPNIKVDYMRRIVYAFCKL